jgi:hypothetical protein
MDIVRKLNISESYTPSSESYSNYSTALHSSINEYKVSGRREWKRWRPKAGLLPPNFSVGTKKYAIRITGLRPGI